MLEQEMASIIKYVLDRAGGPSPYYWNVPRHFSIPAAYFPTPELDTGGETFLTYWTLYGISSYSTGRGRARTPPGAQSCRRYGRGGTSYRS